mmetsp:Transcript_43648/g.70746  ORF Transcript_43648/g.70746 Transcript_43648/m.70746 type:complete len:251 (-) Transcript_43648:143-895(-)
MTVEGSVVMKVLGAAGQDSTISNLSVIELTGKCSMDCAKPARGSSGASSLFWQEVFSALSMMLPSLYALSFAPELAARGAAFPEGIWVLTYASCVHCPFSMAYHLTNAFRGGDDYEMFRVTPFRTADLSAIHLCAIAFAWALSRGSVLFTALLALLNLHCVRLLVRDQLLGRKGSLMDACRVSYCVLAYTLPLLWRGDYRNYAGALLSFATACSLHSMGSMGIQLHGWNHGLFHVMLTPYLHFLLSSTVA